MPIALAELEPPVCGKTREPFHPLDYESFRVVVEEGETNATWCPFGHGLVHSKVALVDGVLTLVHRCFSNCGLHDPTDDELTELFRDDNEPG